MLRNLVLLTELLRHFFRTTPFLVPLASTVRPQAFSGLKLPFGAEHATNFGKRFAHTALVKTRPLLSFPRSLPICNKITELEKLTIVRLAGVLARIIETLNYKRVTSFPKLLRKEDNPHK